MDISITRLITLINAGHYDELEELSSAIQETLGDHWFYYFIMDFYHEKKPDYQEIEQLSYLLNKYQSWEFPEIDWSHPLTSTAVSTYRYKPAVLSWLIYNFPDIKYNSSVILTMMTEMFIVPSKKRTITELDSYGAYGLFSLDHRYLTLAQTSQLIPYLPSIKSVYANAVARTLYVSRKFKIDKDILKDEFMRECHKLMSKTYDISEVNHTIEYIDWYNFTVRKGLQVFASRMRIREIFRKEFEEVVKYQTEWASIWAMS